MSSYDLPPLLYRPVSIIGHQLEALAIGDSVVFDNQEERTYKEVKRGREYYQTVPYKVRSAITRLGMYQHKKFRLRRIKPGTYKVWRLL